MILRKDSAAKIVLAFFLTLSLWLVYVTNCLDPYNKDFVIFQWDSDQLAVSSVNGARENLPVLKEKEEEAYLAPWPGSGGLSSTYNFKRSFTSENPNYLNKDNFVNGVSIKDNSIAFFLNKYSKLVIKPGNSLKMFGRYYTISEVVQSPPDYLSAKIKEKIPESFLSYPYLDYTYVYSSDGSLLPQSALFPYPSNFGLQGYAYYFYAKMFPFNTEKDLRLILSFLSALIFTLTVIEINKKYNALAAACFYAVFLLSPWIVNFGRNLYWVAFLLFLPMLIGLYFINNIENKKIRIACYIFSFLAILIKSLCGFEFLSAVMFSLIVFPLADFFKSLTAKKSDFKLFKRILILSFAALFGFIAAFLFFSTVRGEGNVARGVSSIYNEDVKRRTLGGDPNAFDNIYVKESIKASVFDVLSAYLNFNTQIILGMPGELFKLLIYLPVLIFFYRFSMGKLNWEELFLYILTMLSSVSWFVLGKAHSYIHTHINYVLWYFGFIQICFYVILNFIFDFIKIHNSSCMDEKNSCLGKD